MVPRYRSYFGEVPFDQMEKELRLGLMNVVRKKMAGSDIGVLMDMEKYGRI